MQCELCPKSTIIYSGYINPWTECSVCGALYCDKCSRGQTPESPGYASPEALYRLSKEKRCPRCDGPVHNYKR